LTVAFQATGEAVEAGDVRSSTSPSPPSLVAYSG